MCVQVRVCECLYNCLNVRVLSFISLWFSLSPLSYSVPSSYLQLVGGKQCKAVSGSSMSVLAPDGAVLAYCPDGGRKDVRNAVEAAIKVQPG